MDMKKVSLIILIAILSVQAFAQVLEPVKWTFRSEQNGDQVQLIFAASIEQGWRLYDTKLPGGGPVPTSFHFNDNPHIEPVGELVAHPTSTEKLDKIFKINLRFFSEKAEFIKTFKLKNSEPIVIDGFLEFMCCTDEACLPPTEVDFSFKTEPFSADKIGGHSAERTEPETAVSTEPADDANTFVETAVQSDKLVAGERAEKGKEGAAENLWVFIFFSFLAGLAAILTPCVFPVIPMTLSFFMHSGASTVKARMYAVFYGISIIAIYTIVGTVVALIFGPNIANWLSTHWIPNLIFFLVFMMFAFSLFGMFEISLPSGLVNKSNRQVDKGGFVGSFFMALTLVLVSFSCTGPIVGAILVESAGGALLKPIVGMLGFSLAFALPFTFLALFPGWLNNLPKSGGWLNSVKVVLGFLELAFGLKFLSVADQTYHWGILDRDVYLALWIVIFALLGMYLLGKLKFPHDSDVKHITVPRLMLSIASFAFVVYLIPGMFGAPLKAISGYMPPMTTHGFDLHQIIRDEIKLNAGSGGLVGGANHEGSEEAKYHEFLHLPHGLTGYFDYEQGMAVAKAQHKPVFIDFTGHGCVNCREMEANVWSDPRVLERLRNDYIVIALYVDDRTALPEEEWITSTNDGKVKKTIGKKYADFQITRFGVNAQPYYVLLDHEGQELTQPKAYDLNADHFMKFLDDGLANFKAQAN
jgi:thiol:disulfide interchange protein DsbD